MPVDGQYSFLPKPQILSFEEVARLARLFVDLGVRKLRLTGGEPLLRAEIELLIKQLAAIEGVEDLFSPFGSEIGPGHDTNMGLFSCLTI